jgi:hypothetical protein
MVNPKVFGAVAMLPKFEIDPTGAPPAGRGLQRRWVVLILLGMTPIAALAIVWGTARVRSSARLRGAIAVAEASDPGRWKLADLWAARATVPEEENSALIVRSVARAVPVGWFGTTMNGQPVGTRDEQRRMQLLDQLTRSEPTQVLAAEDLVPLRADLAALGTALDDARSIADHPRGRYAITPATNFYATAIDHVAAPRLVDRILLLDAVRRSANRDIDGAVDDVRAIVNVGRSVGDEPVGHSQLSRMLRVANGLSVLERVLAQGEASDAALERLQRLLEDEARFPHLEWAARGERAGAFDVFSRLANGRMSFNQFFGTMTASRWPYPLAPPRIFFEYNSGLTLSLMNDAVTISRQPPREQPLMWASWESRLVALRTGPIQMFASSLTTLALPSLRGMANRSLDLAARLASARVMLAAERYRLAHGDWPRSIEELVPTYLDQPINDPLGPGTIHLKRSDDGLLIYSIGGDGEDQGGPIRVELDRGSNSSFVRGASTDVGYRLYDVLQRRRPAGRVVPLPERVFEADAP